MLLLSYLVNAPGSTTSTRKPFLRWKLRTRILERRFHGAREGQPDTYLGQAGTRLKHTYILVTKSSGERIK